MIGRSTSPQGSRGRWRRLARAAGALLAAACLSAASAQDAPGDPPPKEQPPADCPGDLNGDGFVSGYDLGYLLVEWGSTNPFLGGDINDDGVVNGIDIGILLAGWGDCPGD